MNIQLVLEVEISEGYVVLMIVKNPPRQHIHLLIDCLENIARDWPVVFRLIIQFEGGKDP